MLTGVKPNEFKDWRVEVPENEEAEILQRAYQLKDLVEVTRPQALEAAKKLQEIQNKVQNNAANVRIEPLEPGQQVMIKDNDAISNKLNANYRGPYTVVRRARNGNYVLQDVL